MLIVPRNRYQHFEGRGTHTRDAVYVYLTLILNRILFQLINLLVAGRDTARVYLAAAAPQVQLTILIKQTACLLTYAFYMLAEHPEISDRLRQEILSKVGSTNRPSYDDIRDMKYLRAFINGTYTYQIS